MKTTNTKYTEIPPNAARTLAALRELGYDSLAAISDLIDNSLDAGATRIDVTVRAIGQGHAVEILDDGRGMDRDTLREALRLGTEAEGREADDLGKYGMGLVTASLSIARTIYVMTREEGGPAHEAIFDVDTVERHNRWVMELKPARHRVIETIGQRGTLVRLTNVDRLDDTNVSRIGNRLRAHVGRVFRRFIQQGVTITVNRKKALAFDPLMRDHELTAVRYDGPVDLGKKRTAHLTVVELPDLGAMEDEKAGIVPQTSGFYVVRNGREIMAAQTFGFYKHHHSYSHFRAELSFGGELDQDFHVDVKKTSIMPNADILEKLYAVARKYIEQSGREGRDRAVERVKLLHGYTRNLIAPLKQGATPSFDAADLGSPDKLFQAEGDTIIYNKRHPLIQLMASLKLQKANAVLDVIALALARMAESNPAVMEEFNASLSALLAASQEGDTWEGRDRAAKKSRK